MDKQERIVCAAVKLNLGDAERVELYVYYPESLAEQYATIGSIGFVKGFITNKNRFVDPKEAWEIAEDAEQINYDTIDYSCYEENGYQELNPEDLY